MTPPVDANEGNPLKISLHVTPTWDPRRGPTRGAPLRTPAGDSSMGPRGEPLQGPLQRYPPGDHFIGPLQCTASRGPSWGPIHGTPPSRGPLYGNPRGRPLEGSSEGVPCRRYPGVGFIEGSSIGRPLDGVRGGFLSIMWFLVKKYVEYIKQHMSCDVQFSRFTSPSNGASYQVIKPWAPRSYNRCSKRPPSISRQTAVLRAAFSQTRFNMLASTVVTAA
jgi:hypothetical protein